MLLNPIMKGLKPRLLQSCRYQSKVLIVERNIMVMLHEVEMVIVEVNMK